MGKNIGIIEKDVDAILLSKDYLNTLLKIGFSKEFISNEQIRRMKECINYLMEIVSELKKEATSSNKIINRLREF